MEQGFVLVRREVNAEESDESGLKVRGHLVNVKRQSAISIQLRHERSCKSEMFHQHNRLRKTSSKISRRIFSRNSSKYPGSFFSLSFTTCSILIIISFSVRMRTVACGCERGESGGAESSLRRALEKIKMKRMTRTDSVHLLKRNGHDSDQNSGHDEGAENDDDEDEGASQPS